MKNKILTFIIGFLVGAIITTICFYAYIRTNNGRMMGMPDRGEMPQMMQEGGTPPERPTGDAQNSNTIPEFPTNTTN